MLAKEAKDSADRMEGMTLDMHTFAHKSKCDAEAMKIITVVTLVFLPATFVSVHLPHQSYFQLKLTIARHS